MALPQLNDSPKYELTIPSTQQTVRFRPFLVKEEKVMLMAMESENQADILNTIVDTISACVVDQIDSTRFTTFDVEYCFLQIRAKSVGETVTLNLNCEECDTPNEVKVKVDDIKVDVPTVDNIIQIDDRISVEMHWPTFDQVLKQNVFDGDSNVNQMFGLVRSCISAILTEEERFDARDHKAEELDQFIESMNNEQFAKIQSYVEVMPRLSHEVKYKCANCSHDNTLVVEGMQNFF